MFERLAQLFNAIPTLIFFLLLALVIFIYCNIAKAFFNSINRRQKAASVQNEVAALRAEVHALREKRDSY
jgi:large-conductance mechanosensitive channel